MSLPEKAAYLRGLYDGMELDAAKSKEARMLNAIIEVIEEMAGHVAENEESISSMADQMDDMADLLDLLNECVMGEDTELENLDDEDEDYEDDGEFATHFQVECPNCQRTLDIDEEILSEGEIECPTCGQRFQVELEFEEDKDDEEDEISF